MRISSHPRTGRGIIVGTLAIVAVAATPALAREGVGDRVFHDVNNNGVMDVGEPGIPGVTLTLDADNGSGTLDPVTGYWSGAPDCVPDNLPAYPQRSEVTNADGSYFFAAAGNGNYIVTLAPSNFVLGGPLAGYTSSTGSILTTGPYEPGIPESNNLADDNRDHGTNTANSIRACGVELRHGTEPVGEPPTPGLAGDVPDDSQNTTVDFGVFKPAVVPGGGVGPGSGGGSTGGNNGIWSIGDRVWNDLDGDGRQDKGEPGIAGAKVILYDLAGRGVGAVTTDKTGNYRLNGLVAGSFRIGFADLPLGASPSPAKQGPRTSDSDVLRRTGRTAQIDVAAGAARTDIDAGFKVPTAIAGRVWRDADVDGQQDATEKGVRGVRVRLVTTTGQVVATTVTSSKGKFRFLGITPGSYRVVLPSLPSGLTLTHRNRGSDATDSDLNVVTRSSGRIGIVRGKQVLTVGAGLRK